MFRKINLILLLLLNSFVLLAKNPHPYFRNYTTNDGLPSSEVHYCIQDTEGYMWFATDNGISRFDGYHFKNYGFQEGLKHNVVLYMQVDPTSKIWLATLNGHLYYIENNQIYPFEHNGLIEQTNKNSRHIDDFYIDSLGTKYLSVSGEGIYKFSIDHTYQFLHPSKYYERFAISIGDRWMMSYFLLQYHNVKLPEKQETKYKFHPIEIYGDSIYRIDKDFRVKAIKESPFWIKNIGDEQILGFAQGNFFLLKNQNVVWSKGTESSIRHKSIYETTDGQILMGCQHREGIKRYQNLDQFKANIYDVFLKGVSVTQIYKDRKGAYWISSLEHGIFYCPDFELKIYDVSAGFPADHITAFDFKNKGNLYVGFRNGQVIQLDHLQNKIHLIPELTKKNVIVYDLLYDGQRKELWTTTGDVFVYQADRWKVLARPFQYHKRKGNSIISYNMTLSRDKNHIMGSRHSGFGMIDLNQKKASYVSLDYGIEDRSFSLWEDRQHRIWVGNVKGLFELKDNKLKRPSPFRKEFSTRVEDIRELKDGTLVLGTKGEGVLLWKENYFHQLTTQDGLSSDMLENIFVDDQDQIWAGTLAGLNKITPQDTSFLIETYNISHGLPSNEITQVKTFEDQLWVATTKGLIEWQEKPKNIQSPKPIIASLFVNNQIVDFQKNNTFSHHENNLEFHFLSINYQLNGNIAYRFRLNDQNWNYTNNRTVNFAKLSPGDYNFKIQSQNENGVWSASRQFRFVISTPIWLESWFHSLLIFSLLLGTYFLYQNRVKKAKESLLLEKEINNLKLSALQAQMNPHFIFNCLNTVQGFIVQRQNDKAMNYLANFSKLVRGILHISMAEQISLQEEVQLLKRYLELEQMRFKNHFTYEIIIDPQLNLFNTEIPPMIVQPFVENAIVHGIQREIKNNKIHIEYMLKDNDLCIKILDNGIGINTSKAQKQYAINKNQSVGISLVRKRLDVLQQHPHQQNLKIREIKNDNGISCGTEVTFKIKVN